MEAKTMKAIETKYLPATSFKGSRIKAYAEGGNSLTIGYPHELSGQDVHEKAAILLCKKMSWSTDLLGGGKADGNGYVFVFKNQGMENMTKEEGRQHVKDILHEAEYIQG